MSEPTGHPLDSSTRLAVDRTFVAYERTMLAWVRTAVSLIAFGFTVYKAFQFMRTVEGLPRSEGFVGPHEYALLMIGAGEVTLVLGVVQFRRSVEALRRTYGGVPRSFGTVVALLMAVFGIVLFVAVLFRQ